ncbi:hypothetical protein ACFOWM_06160 [Ferruginibacter yonginensis]|uniref:Phage protein n=1 Tax=Ferruginibacter yonginensis TaxID=1310416 RepID=A0ABV8QS29_9BACT
MWKVTEHKLSRQAQELKVSMLVKQMAQNTYATYADAFIEQFKSRINDIPRSNNYSANLLYECKWVNHYAVEVNKLDVEGNFKYKMFTVEFENIKSSL